MASLAQWLAYLESIHPTTIDMGLERVKLVAQKLNFNWHNITVVTVGGTNGKGSTCKFLEYYWLSTGKSVATYRSPHLLDYRERVTLNAEIRDESEYIGAFETVEAARGEVSLTYFEFGTLAALVMMQQWRPDIVLLEVGLGGRLDATNIVDSQCAVITTIGLDHQDYLGDTRELIATEKAGIFRQGCPIVIGEIEPPHTLLSAAEANNSSVALANRDFHFLGHEQHWDWHGKHYRFSQLPLPNVLMQNVSAALAVLESLKVELDEAKVAAACQNAKLTGRQQVLCESPHVMLDVAHNPQGAQSLLPYIYSRIAQGKVHLVVAMLKDKDIDATLACFAQLDVSWYLASTSGSRGCDAQSLAKHVSGKYVSTYATAQLAYAAALAGAEQEDSIFVFGSFLTVADVLAYEQERQQSGSQD